MLYEIEYTETNVGYFDVEADNEEDALNEFWRLVGEGEVDLLDTSIEEADASVSRWYIPENVLNTVLEDDGTPNGGTAFAGERVVDFLLSANVNDGDIKSMDDLNELLELNGIKPVSCE